MSAENEKKSPEEKKKTTEEPPFEEDEGLDQTMMDIDAKQFAEKVSEKKESPEPKIKGEEESVEDMLKKKKSWAHRLGLKKIFGKK